MRQTFKDANESTIEASCNGVASCQGCREGSTAGDVKSRIGLNQMELPRTFDKPTWSWL